MPHGHHLAIDYTYIYIHIYIYTHKTSNPIICLMLMHLEASTEMAAKSRHRPVRGSKIYTQLCLVVNCCSLGQGTLLSLLQSAMQTVTIQLTVLSAVQAVH